MISRQDVIALYANQVNGVHRHNTEEFYQLEAREKVYHMGPGATALDFGCGTADLLAYYARHFETMVGVDISDNMLRHAAARLERFGVRNVTLQQADDLSVWPWLGERRFDVITSAAVMQYFSSAQISEFLKNAKPHLAPGGRIVMFDIVDPRMYWLFKYGWATPQPITAGGVARALARTSKMLAVSLLKALRLRPRADLMGYTHHPGSITAQAAQAGYDVAFVRSMYYEYRYHALLTPRA